MDDQNIPPEFPPELRAHPRYNTNQRCWLKMGTKKPRWMKFKTKNLSRNGCCLAMSGLPQQLGLKVKSKFDMVILVDIGSKVIRLHHFEAYVIHIQKNGDVGFFFQKRPQIL